MTVFRVRIIRTVYCDQFLVSLMWSLSVLFSVVNVRTLFCVISFRTLFSMVIVRTLFSVGSFQNCI